MATDREAPCGAGNGVLQPQLPLEEGAGWWPGTTVGGPLGGRPCMSLGVCRPKPPAQGDR